MTYQERIRQIELVNSDELNQACRNHLPPDRRASDALYCLSLAGWGLHQGVRFHGGASLDGVEAMWLRLLKMPPARALEWLLDDGGGGVLLQASEIEAVDREEAARLLVELLHERLTERQG